MISKLQDSSLARNDALAAEIVRVTGLLKKGLEDAGLVQIMSQEVKAACIRVAGNIVCQINRDTMEET